MGEIIQIITQKPFSINNIEWFKNTNINYQIQGRKSLTNIKGTWKLNQYFLYDIYENIKPFNAYYLSMLVDVDENVPKIDSEFNIGFNNTDFMYEKEFINLFMEEEIY
ncbi:hypothetical protein, partial [Vallitalea sp.]|uniref:hypothetical protein n=1 Tax=Vallitalea sp. TaxID=1882829 RepID=UPI0025FF5AC6